MKKLKILVVLGLPEDRERVRRLFSRPDLEVKTSGCMIDGLSILKIWHPDAVLVEDFISSNTIYSFCGNRLILAAVSRGVKFVALVIKESSKSFESHTYFENYLMPHGEKFASIQGSLYLKSDAGFTGFLKTIDALRAKYHM